MKKIFAANWKLNKSPNEARKFIQEFQTLASKNDLFYNTREVFIFPSAFALEAVTVACEKLPIQCGPQNIHSEKHGAYTGENSLAVACELGAKSVLIGHSERRQLFQETDVQLNLKIKLGVSLNVIPLFCIGESLHQRQAGQTETVCFAQLESGLAGINTQERLIVAYEPIWAIGTGQVATVNQVAETHQKLNEKLTQLGFINFQILYGGSVKPENASELLQIPFVDGFLIGGAALDVQSFFKICMS